MNLVALDHIHLGTPLEGKSHRVLIKQLSKVFQETSQVRTDLITSMFHRSPKIARQQPHKTKKIHEVKLGQSAGRRVRPDILVSVVDVWNSYPYA